MTNPDYQDILPFMEDYASNQPKFKKGISSGYDVRKGNEYGTWRFSDGRRGTKARVMAAVDSEGSMLVTVPGEPEEFGFTAGMQHLTPHTDKLQELEILLQGEDISRVAELSKGERKADTIPPDILANMKLSELYSRSEGDVFQIIEAPMDLSLKEVEIECPDTTMQSELEAIYDADEGIDIDYHLYQVWFAMSIYGQAFPLEAYDESGDLAWIIHLNPKYMNVGIGPGGFTLGLSNSEREWSQKAIQSQLPPLSYQSFAPGWNETALAGNDIPISKEFCIPVRDKAHAWERYAMPGMSRAFRAINTRRVMEEMLRATMEGYRNQLWVFKIGSPERAPSVQHLTALKGALSTMAGERTGTLVWWDAPLSVDVYAPETFDEMSGVEAWRGLTQEIFRRLGVHLRVVSGEGSTGAMGGGDPELDIRILMERTKFRRRQVMKWEYHLRMNIGRKMLGGSKSAMDTLKKTIVRVARSPLEIEREVKEVLMPVYQAGLLSSSTMLSLSGVSTYEVELQKKKDEEKDAELFGPKATYAQETVNPGAEEKKSEIGQDGRTPDAQNKKKQLEASFEGEPAFDELVTSVYENFEMALDGDLGISEFVATMRHQMSKYTLIFARHGYEMSGGAGVIDNEWAMGASRFINSFIGGLESDMIGSDNLESFWWRVYLYPQELRNLAHMRGVQQAMKERGARGWRRVLHPEASVDGPCMDCIRDSSIVHSITEPFFEFHPNGVCSAQGVMFYTSAIQPIMEVPVPGKITLPERIREIIEKIGEIGKVIIRRIRL